MSTIAARFFPKLRPIREVHRVLVGELEGVVKRDAQEGIFSYAKLSNRLVHIELQNESRKNSISARMMLDLVDIVDRLYFETAYDSCLGLVLRSTGTHFSSGLNLNLLKSYFNTPSKGVAMYDLMTDSLNRIRDGPFVSVRSNSRSFYFLEYHSYQRSKTGSCIERSCHWRWFGTRDIDGF